MLSWSEASIREDEATKAAARQAEVVDAAVEQARQQTARTIAEQIGAALTRDAGQCECECGERGRCGWCGRLRQAQRDMVEALRVGGLAP
jgi:hypothetical protein